MTRAIVAGVLGLLMTVTVVFAKDVKGTFIKYEEGSVTVSVDDKETTFKTDDKSVMIGKKDKQVPVTEFAKVFGKVKVGTKLELKVSDKDVIEEIKMAKTKKKDK